MGHNQTQIDPDNLMTQQLDEQIEMINKKANVISDDNAVDPNFNAEQAKLRNKKGRRTKRNQQISSVDVDMKRTKIKDKPSQYGTTTIDMQKPVQDA